MNLPKSITFENVPTELEANKIEYVYDATGVKLQKQVNHYHSGDKVNMKLTYYDGGFIYEEDRNYQMLNGYLTGNEIGLGLQFFAHAEGYVEPNGNNYDYIYQYKDHLGNIRLSYKQGISDLEIVEENNYYPFGLKHKGYNNVVNGEHYPYGYNGKEENDELGLKWLDFGARNYDASLGRWMNIDPLAEKMRRHSPYNYAFNNPVYWIDPDGRSPQAPQDGGSDYDTSGRSKFDRFGIYIIPSDRGEESIGDFGIMKSGNKQENQDSASESDNSNPIKGFFSLQLENFKKLKIQIGLEWENKSNKHFDFSGKASLDATVGKNFRFDLGASLNAKMGLGGENIQGVASFTQGYGFINNGIYNLENKYITTNISLNFKQQSNDKIYDSFTRMMLSFSPVQPITYHFQSRINGGLNPRGGFQLDLKSSTTDFKTVNQDITLKRLMFYYKYAHLFNK